MIPPKTVSAHWNRLFLQSLKFGMLVLRTWRATRAESSVLVMGDIFDLRIIYNVGIVSASLFGKLCDLLRVTCICFADPLRNSGIAYNFILILFDSYSGKLSFHCVL